MVTIKEINSNIVTKGTTKIGSIILGTDGNYYFQMLAEFINLSEEDLRQIADYIKRLKLSALR